jgi:hypothetical protein
MRTGPAKGPEVSISSLVRYAVLLDENLDGKAEPVREPFRLGLADRPFARQDLGNVAASANQWRNLGLCQTPVFE